MKLLLENWREYLKENAGLDIWYHITDSTRVLSIEEFGLKTDQEACLTNSAGKWAHEYYGRCPIYLSQDPYINEEEAWEWGINKVALFEIDVTGLTLVADLQGLADIHGQITDEGTIWWEAGSEPDALLELLAEYNGETDIMSFIEDEEHIKGAIASTRSAAVLEDISPERIKRIK